MNYSEIESKVREATSDDPWGPSGQLMGEIAKYVKLTYTQLLYMLSTLCHYNMILLRRNKSSVRREYRTSQALKVL